MTHACAKSIWALAVDEALKIEKLTAGYAGTVVIDNVDLTASPGETVAVLGRNGVGKTTLLATIAGHTQLYRGRVRVGPHDLTALAPHKRARARVAYVPQEREIFPSLTVLENLQVARLSGDPNMKEEMLELFPSLKARLHNQGNQLSGGEQQMLSMARALMMRPNLLLLDEPLEGLAPVIVDQLIAAIERLRATSRMCVLLVEQHADIALDCSDNVIVLDRGKIVYRGASRALRSDAATLERLLGVH
jgi:branched-chain amino acid transport system ATP-binding protein